MIKYILFFILLLLIPDIYIWAFYTRQANSCWATVVLLLPTVVTLACIGVSLACPGASVAMSTFFALLICVAVPKLAFMLVDALALGVGRFWPAVLPWGHWGAVAVALLMACVQVFGTCMGWKRLQVHPMTMRVYGLPRQFEGYRIVHMSDLHLGTYAKDDAFVRRVVDSVNACRPDLIVFTGDLVNTSASEVPPYMDALKGLRARDGVVAVLGNHDYCIYGAVPHDRRAQEVRDIVRMEREMGWRVLMNEHLVLHRGEDSLVVAGVENVSKPPFLSVGRLDDALRDVRPEACVVLLSHDPWHWKNGVLQHKANIALTLSGHTHAMQMQIGRFSPAQWVSHEWGGLYKTGHRRIFVSTGIGGTISYRLGAWPSVECYTLVRE